MRMLRLMLAALVACFMVLTGITGVRAATYQNYTCQGGTAISPQVIPPGDYGALTISGVCTIPAGVVTVHGNATIASNAALHASSLTATLTVLGSMIVGANGVLALGNDSVRGNIVAFNALGLQLRSDTVGGSVFFQGGGGGVNCNPNPMFGGGPAFSAIEDNIINGSVSVLALHTCWFGIFRNQVKGNVTVDYNTAANPDATEITDNTISGNLSCFHNNPAAQVGDSGGGPNTVAGQKLGECATL